MGRTTVEIDGKLLEEAKAAIGARTTKEVVNEGLRVLARRKQLREFAALQGTGFIGLTHNDLEKMRENE